MPEIDANKFSRKEARLLGRCYQPLIFDNSYIANEGPFIREYASDQDDTEAMRMIYPQPHQPRNFLYQPGYFLPQSGLKFDYHHDKTSKSDIDFSQVLLLPSISAESQRNLGNFFNSLDDTSKEKWKDIIIPRIPAVRISRLYGSNGCQMDLEMPEKGSASFEEDGGVRLQGNFSASKADILVRDTNRMWAGEIYPYYYHAQRNNFKIIIYEFPHPLAPGRSEKFLNMMISCTADTDRLFNLNDYFYQYLERLNDARNNPQSQICRLREADSELLKEVQKAVCFNVILGESYRKQIHLPQNK